MDGLRTAWEKPSTSLFIHFSGECDRHVEPTEEEAEVSGKYRPQAGDDGIELNCRLGALRIGLRKEHRDHHRHAVEIGE